MFGIGFWEFVLITVLILLVLGPEKIGPIMRTLGRAMHEIQKGVFQMKQELKLDEDLDRVGEIKNKLVRDVIADEEEVEKSSTKEPEKGALGSKETEKKPSPAQKWDELHEGDDVEVIAEPASPKNEKNNE